jgi:TetR/AcrR family transcriptional repressor of nem operon
MTNSAPATSGSKPANRPSKRQRLIDAAGQLFHQQGVERTTLAEIAGAADVPLGNVYYYYKTKDDIVEAVVTARLAALDAGFAALEQAHRTPGARLKAFFDEQAGQAELISLYGCPFGTLSSELEKRAHGADHHAAQLMQAPIDWAERQFREMGRANPRGLAIQLIAAYQGAAVLTHALGAPDLMTREARRVDRWVDSLRK